jgi:aminoglycoside phosphotransferase (APT) family kinase protein
VKPLGPKIAEGRDSEIFEHGAGRVLRRNFVARDLTNEARVMSHVRKHGYPVPEVFDVGNGWMVMERVNGVDLLDSMPKTVTGVRAAGHELARLHNELAKIPAPDFLPPAPGDVGDAIVHLDLHPMNVMTSERGSVVIDWGNAKRGVAATDVANTWALLKAGQVDGKLADRVIVLIGRGLLLRSFLSRVDRTAAARQMRALVEWRAVDRHMSPKEIALMQALVAKVDA